ncbi:MAG: hypothetical protein IJQ86_00565 [Spirochaetia bacterium]|nr:hypothetical protein [Spirochaetia bacterium]
MKCLLETGFSGVFSVAVPAGDFLAGGGEAMFKVFDLWLCKKQKGSRSFLFSFKAIYILKNVKAFCGVK